MSIKNYIKRGLQYIISGRPNTFIEATINYSKPGNLLKDRKIIVTGGGRGLGYAMAKKFITEGAKVVIVGRTESTLSVAAEQIGCDYILADVTNVSIHPEIITESIKMMGGCDTLVNNAGISLHEGDFMNVTPIQFDEQFNCNLRGSYFLSQQFLRMSNPNQRRNILFVSSERGFQADDLPYGLTKTAINSLIKGLAFRYVKDNVRVNGVAPDVTSSDMTGVAKDGNLYYPSNSNNRAYLAEEVAEVATFLISDISSCVSGEIIQCNEAKTVNAHWR